MLFRRLMLVSVLVVAQACVDEAQDEQPGLQPPAPPHINVPDVLPEHPRLFINQQEIDDLKAWADRDPVVRDYMDAFIARSLASIRDLPELRALDALQVLADSCPLVGAWLDDFIAHRMASISIPLPSKNKGDHNVGIARQAQALAFAYVLSDQVELAEAAARILVGYIEHVPNYTESGMKGLVTSSALGESAWATRVACAYDLIYNAGVLTDEQKLRIEQDVLKPSAEVMRRCNHAGRSNWRMVAVAGFGTIGFAINDRDLIDEALNGYFEDGRLRRDGFGHHVAWSMLDDGMYYERSLGYTEYVSATYPALLESARHCGINLWTMEMPGCEWGGGADQDRNFGQTGPRTIKGLFDAPFYRTMGDYSQMSIANVRNPSLFPPRPHIEAAWRAYRDPKYAWLARRGRHGRMPRNPVDMIWMTPDMSEGHFDLSDNATLGVTGRQVNACTLLPNGGITILRQNGSEDATAVLMTYGLWGSSHCHADQLSITLYSAGHAFIPEPDWYTSYGHPKFLSWSRQTIAHNTVTVDETSQAPQGDLASVWVDPGPGHVPYSQPTLFHAGGQLKGFRAVAEPGRAYEGVAMDRTIALVDSLVVDFFRVRSEDEHQYDFTLHVDGQLMDVAEPPLSEKLGYRHITDMQRAGADDDEPDFAYTRDDGTSELAYARDDGTGPQLHLTFLPTGKAEFIVGKGIVGQDGQQADVVIVRKMATDADFVTVMDPASRAGKRVSAKLLTDLPEGVLGVSVARPDGSKAIIISADVSRTFEWSGVAIAGRLALLRTNAEGETKLIDIVE